MTQCRFAMAVGAALTASAALLTVLPARAQEEAAPPGVEVLARGPIHEAYAESAGGEPKESPTVTKEPPAPIDELPPDQKPDGDNVQWMPGYWGFDEVKQDYLWISGFWRSPPPNRRWVPGHWKDVAGGWQWIPGFWGPAEEDEVAYLPPPPAPVVMALPPPASPDQVYVPGCWVWRDDHYAWRPGYYIPCRPDWIWVPAHYVWTPCGHVFVDGYWDYTLKDRGILFSPVAIDRSVIRVGFVYTPAYAVHHETLCGAMFVRPGCRCYFYGDYFDNSYSSAGYVSWCSVSVGYSDPMFAYYRVQNRSDPQWEIQLNLTFTGRYNGTIARPPVTVIQNRTTIVNNTTIINNTTVVNNRFVAAGAGPMPLREMAGKGVKMAPVTPQERQAHAVAARQIVQASHARAETEKRVLSQGPPPTKPTDKPRTAKLDLPKAPPPSAKAAALPPAHSDAKPAAHSAAPTPAATHPAAPTPAAHTPAPAPAHPAAAPAAHTPAPAPAHPAVAPAVHTPAPAPGHPAPTAAPQKPAPAPAHPAPTAAPQKPAPAPAHPAPTAAPQKPAPAPAHPAPPAAPAGQGQKPPSTPPAAGTPT